MTTHNKRRCQRLNSKNLIYYICLDADDKEFMQGMGRTLDISEGGILMETHVPIDPQHVMVMTIGMEDDMMDIKGEIVYSRKRKDGMFESGIHFKEIDEVKSRFLKQFIIIFTSQENQA